MKLFGFGYMTREGAVFQTHMHLMNQGQCVGSPGDLMLVEGSNVKNLSRIGSGCSVGVSFPVRGTKFTSPASLCYA